MTTPHPATTPAAPEPLAARHAAARRFLGEELSPEPEPTETPWLVKAVLSGSPRLELSGDGVLPARPSGLLPLRHGVDALGAPAPCLLQAGALARLRELDGEASEIDCAACRAWAMRRREAARRAQPDVLERIRAAIGDVLHSAA